MIYNDFQGKKLSALGFGCMRLPCVDGKDGQPDEQKVFEMTDYAISKGVNYFDTAWGYHEGQSEIVIGKALSRYPRESFYLADKFPGYDLSNMDKAEAIFEKQLLKCGVSYFDFYLFHNVCEKNIDAYLNEKYGILSYLLKQKENGRIKHLGFSAHGDIPVLRRFLDAYGEYMEFGQIQLNYLDYGFQNAEEKVALLTSRRIPVWVMEPLRGGRLASLSEKHASSLKALRPEESIPAWAFRFLQSVPPVAVTISGMSNIEQLKENIKTFEESHPLSKNEVITLLDIAEEMAKEKTVPCTACRYCTSKCPQELDIPHLISLYNEDKLTGGGFIAPMALGSMSKLKRPSACIGCRSCEKVCPQQIKIADIMADFAENTPVW